MIAPLPPANPEEPDPTGGTSSPGGGTPEVLVDAVVVGSGVAGLSAVLALAEASPSAREGGPSSPSSRTPRRIALLTLGSAGRDGATAWAQGGVAAALDPSDSAELHALDTVKAGGGLVRRDRARILTGEGPSRVRRLLELGARFDRTPDGNLALALEGAHSRRRVLHAGGDRTGAEISRVLWEAVRRIPTVEVLERTQALELLVGDGRIQGVLARGGDGIPFRILAPAVLLATGGCSGLFLRSTAPRGMTGDGLAMAARAGARLVDLEFIQFHPTALDVDADPLPLVSEALRGEGAVLVDGSGNRILGEGPEGELGSRDEVSRAIWRVQQRGERVFLDAREAVGADFPRLFPTVHALCLGHGIDPVTEPIPVTPAAHYHMGGIQVDSFGQSSLPGLWAAGEVASSGVHGANRLASNSLLEGLVFGTRAGNSMARACLDVAGNVATQASHPAHRGPNAPLSSLAWGAMDPVGEAEGLREIRQLLWEKVGIVRTEDSLTVALGELSRWGQTPLARTSVAFRNAVDVGVRITRAALARNESRGSHYRADFPPIPSNLSRLGIPA